MNGSGFCLHTNCYKSGFSKGSNNFMRAQQFLQVSLILKGLIFCYIWRFNFFYKDLTFHRGLNNIGISICVSCVDYNQFLVAQGARVSEKSAGRLLSLWKRYFTVARITLNCSNFSLSQASWPSGLSSPTFHYTFGSEPQAISVNLFTATVMQYSYALPPLSSTWRYYATCTNLIIYGAHLR